MGRASVWLITSKPGSSPFLLVAEGKRESHCQPSALMACFPNDLFTYFPLLDCEKLYEEHRVFGDREAAGVWLQLGGCLLHR